MPTVTAPGTSAALRQHENLSTGHRRFVRGILRKRHLVDEKTTDAVVLRVAYCPSAEPRPGMRCPAVRAGDEPGGKRTQFAVVLDRELGTSAAAVADDLGRPKDGRPGTFGVPWLMSR